MKAEGGREKAEGGRGKAEGEQPLAASQCPAMDLAKPQAADSRSSSFRLPPSPFRLSLTILRISIAERLVYRVDFALGTLMRFLPIVTQVFLWGAVFAGMEATQPSHRHIAGYSYEDFIAYYLMTMVSRAFSSMPGLASGIARDIRDGTVKKYLIQPVDMLGFLLLTRVAHKLVYYTVALVPFAAVFYLCRGYFTTSPDTTTVLAFLASLVLSFLLGFFLEATLGMIGFWFLEVSSLLFVYMLINFFLSGHMFPIDMLPGGWQMLLRVVPLQYLAYFPAAVFLGKIKGAELVVGLAVEVAWVALFYATARMAFHYGVRRYSSFGG
jgi:ABC-2 type transport system permease protein